MASAFKVFSQQSSFPFWKEYSRKNTPNLPIAIRQSATFCEHRKNKSRRRQGAKAPNQREKIKTQTYDAEIRFIRLHSQTQDAQGNLRAAGHHKKGARLQGRQEYATRWAAREMARAIRHNDLSDTIIVCIPASCKRTNDRRYKQFMKELCELTGAINGFDLVQPMGKRRKAHIDHVHEIADGASECIHINDNALKGKKVLVVDDIVTTGKTANSFIDMLQSAGADVRGALFLSKTKSYRKNH